MAEVKWIKLSTSIFDNRKIKQIECLPDGYAIIVVWLKLMCLAGTVNDSGLIYLTKEIPYTEQMLAQQFGMPLATVQLALGTFSQFGMIEVIDNVLHISNWEKYQSVDKLTEIREQTNKRVKNFRERKKLIGCEDNVTQCNVTSNVTSNADVTQCNATDIDIDKDIDKEIYKSIVGYLNAKAGTSYRASSEKTKKLIHARLSEGFKEEDFKTVINKKCSDWFGTYYGKFLRPETLFGTKFESYLNQMESEELPCVDAPEGYNDDLPF